MKRGDLVKIDHKAGHSENNILGIVICPAQTILDLEGLIESCAENSTWKIMTALGFAWVRSSNLAVLRAI